MSNTNIFKKHLSIFDKKSVKLVINRENDVYYICDGYTMLKMPAIHYEVYARPVSPAFIPLEDGQCAIRAAGDVLPKISAPSYNAANIFNGHKADEPALITDLLHLGEGKKVMRFVNVNNDKIAIYNNDYINAVMEYAVSDKFNATSDRFPVLKWENADMQLGCLVMPINNATALGNLAYIGGILKK
jgi:hypothetical protein